jgi:hypothetical protein
LTKLKFDPTIEGFAFINKWNFDDYDRGVITSVVDGAAVAAAAILAPVYIPVLGIVVGTVSVVDVLAFIFSGGTIPPGTVTLVTAIELATSGLIDKFHNWLNSALPDQYALCGGMAFAALDYYKKRWVVPQGKSNTLWTDLNGNPVLDSQGNKQYVDVPQRDTPEGKALRDYIFQRLLDSFLSGVAAKTLEWMAYLFLIPSDLGGGPQELLRRTKSEFTKLKQYIDSGTPLPIGLIRDTPTPWKNHQVLVYGYDDPDPTNPTKSKIYVYDNNRAHAEHTITLDLSGDTLKAIESAYVDDVPPQHPLMGFFCEDNYSLKEPPISMGLFSGIIASPLGPHNTGETVQFHFEAKNYGYGDSPSLAPNANGFDTFNQDMPIIIPDGENTPVVFHHGDSQAVSPSIKLIGTVGHRLFFPMCHLKSSNGDDVWKFIPTKELGTIAFVDVYTIPPKFRNDADDNSGAIEFRDTVSVAGVPVASPVLMYDFVSSVDGNLYVNWWNGSQWQWSNQGRPPNTTVSNGLGVITFQENDGTRKIHAFVIGGDGHLFVNWWNGSNWQWSNQGNPTATTALIGPGVITFQHTDGTRRIFAFVMGKDGNLHVDWWDGSNWKWSNLGRPPNTTVSSGPGVITFQENDGTRKIHAFVIGGDGHLWANWWDGSQWQWSDQGGANQSIGLTGPGAITYQDNAKKQHIYVFTHNSILQVNYWDGSNWQWANLGKPLNTNIISGAGVVTFKDDKGTQRTYAFTVGSDGHLYVCYWDGSQWQWSDQTTS